MAPAPAERFRDELTACLALVAPVGMDEAARGEWLAVAWETLKHLPADILAIGARKAREKADHPSKIVPMIVAETAEHMVSRRQERNEYMALPAPPPRRDVMSRRGEPMSIEDTADLNRRLERAGATARYRPDGSRFFVDQPHPTTGAH